MQILSNYIDGIFEKSDTYLDNINPATGDILSKIPRSNAKDVHKAVLSAKKAYPLWKEWSFIERAELLEKVADEIEKRFDEFATLESQDTGKPILLSKTVDIPRAINNFRFFASCVRHYSTDFHTMQNAFNYTLQNPVGVAALISPWNLPLYLLTWKTAPALIMGNTVVAKPSELSPMTSHVLAQIFDRVGLPKGVFNLIHGIGDEAGDALITHDDVDIVSFTGGTKTGYKVAQKTAQTFKKLSLELGGKNPTIIFSDCDFDSSVEDTYRAAFSNQGQICLCGSRILIERSIFDKFTDALIKKAQATIIGDPMDEKTQHGSQISKEHLNKIKTYLKLAREEGGTILCGGEEPVLKPPFNTGYFMKPTLIKGLSHTCRTATEEIFGPIATLHPFDNEKQALSIANTGRYGLSASVFTNDLNRAHHFSKNLDVGMVWVNTWSKRDLRIPFGGVKESGVGREGGEYSLRFFSESKNICIALKEGVKYG